MPNWVNIHLIAKDKKVLEDLLLDERGEVDFNKLIPMPKDLEVIDGSCGYEIPGRYGFFKEQENKILTAQKPVDEELNKLYNDSYTQDVFVELVRKNKHICDMITEFKKFEPTDEHLNNYIKGFYNYKKYGYVSWYYWRLDNWGCKWNGSDTDYDPDTGRLQFQTPWSIPEGIFLELCKHTNIRVEYADEDLGANCGLVDFFLDKKGQPTYQYLMDESDELAHDAWGYGRMDMKDEEGEWIEDENNPIVKEANLRYHAIQEEISHLMTRDSLIAMRG